MALPLGATGTLGPAFASARLVGLAVKLPYALALYARFLTALREPLNASVTFWEATAPVKLPAWHGLATGSRSRLGFQTYHGWYSKVGSTGPGDPASQPPTYPLHGMKEPNAKLE